MIEIGWTQNIIILDECKDLLEREFYLRMTAKFGWTKAVLAHNIEARTFQKYLANQTNFDAAVPAKARNQAKLAVKDEYTFDFLELGEEHSEKELEGAIIAKVGRFLREMGGIFGIVICKSKRRTIVEYSLRESRKPIGVSTYKVFKSVPQDLKGQLPSPAQVSLLLEEGLGR